MGKYPGPCLRPVEIPDSDDPDVLYDALVAEGVEPEIARTAVEERVRR